MMREIKKLSKKLPTFNSQLLTPKGFTLIELMVALTITAILGTLGIAGFATYSRIQVLQSAASDVVSVLNLAKSRAQSQVKLSLCQSGNLDGYSVTVSPPNSYFLSLRCSGVDVPVEQDPKNLPSGLTFSPGRKFFFPIRTGKANEEFGTDSPPWNIVISNISEGSEKTIEVNALGGISVQ